MINKDATITIDSSTKATGSVKQSILDEITALSQTKEWQQAVKKMNDNAKSSTGRGRSKV
jgi:hypothetical protein